MIINPRYQNLSKKFIASVNQSKPAAAKIISENFIKELRKDKIDPDLIFKLQIMNVNNDTNQNN
jgi:hypothetical protein